MHRIAIWISVSIALTAVAFVPSASAAEIADPCDKYPYLCVEVQALPNYYVEDDGRYVEVGREYCYYWGCYRDPIVTVDTCDTNPAALVNVCTTREDNNQEVDAYGVDWTNTPVGAPGVTVTSVYRCIVGNIGCGYYPWATPTWVTYNVPTPQAGPETYVVPAKSVSAYVEFTPLCEMGFDCRVGTDGSGLLATVLA